MKIRVGNFSNQISEAEVDSIGMPDGPLQPVDDTISDLAPNPFGFSPEEASASVDAVEEAAALGTRR